MFGLRPDIVPDRHERVAPQSHLIHLAHCQWIGSKKCARSKVLRNCEPASDGNEGRLVGRAIGASSAFRIEIEWAQRCPTHAGVGAIIDHRVASRTGAIMRDDVGLV
jgi:hypothetical protein